MRRRISQHLTRSAAWLRASGDRATGSVTIGLVGVLVAASVIAGVGSRATLPRLANVGAWLGSSGPGTLVHVNGLSGRPDGQVVLKSAAGHPLRVVQNGSGAYVVDLVTGQVSRIDPAQLVVGQAQGYGAAGVQVVSGSGSAYVVDPRAGRVLRINPTTLAATGSPIGLQPPLGQAGLDGQGTLWVPDLGAGKLVPIHGGKKGKAVTVGNPDDQLDLTIAGGVPVVTNASGAVTTVVGSKGRQLSVNLPSTVASGTPGDLLVPESTDGPTLPVLAASSGAMVLVDLNRGAVTAVSVAASGHRMGTPQVLGQRVYVPDESAGSLVVYDASAGRFDDQIMVTGRAGQLETFVQSGQLWVNDEAGPRALVVDADGSVHAIGKYDAQVPGSRPAGPPTGPPEGVGRGIARPGASPTGAPTGVPTGAPANAPVAPPQAPTGVAATSGPGYITVTFTPPGQGKPTGYTLVGAPAGATVQPSQAPAAGPYAFQVNGGSCGQQYSFAVAALYPGGQATSAATVPVRPCVAPGAPQGLKVAAVEHGANLTWSPPANAGGSQVTYSLAWSGGRSGNQGGITGTSYSVTGLTNFQSYAFTLTAANGAGSGGAAATASANLVGPTGTYGLHNRNNTQGQQTYLQLETSPQANASGPRVPAGANPTFTVICQVSGGYFQDPSFQNVHGSIWDKITGYGGQSNLYSSDLYVLTPQSAAGSYGSFSDPPLWHCT